MRAHALRLVPWLAVATLTAAGAAAAAGYGLTAPKRYRATADLLVAPVSPSDPTFAGLDVLRDTGGRRTAAASVAALLETPQIADAVRAQLALRRSRKSLLHAFRAQVVEGSDVVAATAEDTSASSAAQLADAFANALVAQRSARFQAELAQAVQRDEQLLAATPRAQRSQGAAATVARRLATLRGLEGRPDPTVRVASEATPPTAAYWPELSGLVGFGAGVGAAVGLIVALVVLLLRRTGAVRAAEYDRHVSDGLEELVSRYEQRLAAREAGLVKREQDLQERLDELRAAQEEAANRPPPEVDDSDLRKREEALQERIGTVSRRELELARRAAALAARERELEAAAAAAAAKAAEPEPEPEPQPERAPEPQPAADGRAGSYNLATLERLVEERGDEFPERREEWRSYLFYLRDFADADGVLPAGFDGLIGDTFGELAS